MLPLLDLEDLACGNLRTRRFDLIRILQVVFHVQRWTWVSRHQPSMKGRRDQRADAVAGKFIARILFDGDVPRSKLDYRAIRQCEFVAIDVAGDLMVTPILQVEIRHQYDHISINWMDDGDPSALTFSVICAACARTIIRAV